MDLAQKTAIKETAKVVSGITAIVFVASAAIALLSIQSIATIALVYFLLVCIKLIYDTQLIQARADAYTKQAVIDAEIDRLHK